MAPRKQPTIEVVAGAGGAKGPGLVGAFKALEERRVSVSKVTGVSAGSLMAAFYTNGFSADELAEVYIGETLRTAVAGQFNSLRAWLNPLNRVLGVINLEPQFQELVDRYNLKPRRNLRIIAYNVLAREPVVFEGTRYNLAKAMAASCAIPAVMRPVLYSPRVHGEQKFVTKRASETMAKCGILVDGGVHHFHPTEFCQGPAIVFKLGTASQLPSELPTVLETVFHAAEMTVGRLIGVFQTDSCHNPQDLVIPVGKPDVGGVSFSASVEECRKMIRYGHDVAARYLDEAIAEGRVPVKSRKRRAA